MIWVGIFSAVGENLSWFFSPEQLQQFLFYLLVMVSLMKLEFLQIKKDGLAM